MSNQHRPVFGRNREVRQPKLRSPNFRSEIPFEISARAEICVENSVRPWRAQTRVQRSAQRRRASRMTIGASANVSTARPLAPTLLNSIAPAEVEGCSERGRGGRARRGGRGGGGRGA